MTSGEFVHALAALAPSLQDLKQSMPGLELEDYEGWRQDFLPPAFVPPRPLTHRTDSELDVLLSDYNWAGIAILGGIHLYEEPELNDEQQLIFANGEAGLFSLETTGEVRLTDDFGSLLCARSVERFFDALVVFSDYYRGRLLGTISQDDTMARQVCAQRAALAAGEIAAEDDYLLILNRTC